MPSSERQIRLVERMTLSNLELFGIPIVVVEETMRGWLAAIAKERIVHRQVSAYRELSSLFAFFAAFTIAPFDQAAPDRFDSLQAAKVRISTHDLKIAESGPRIGTRYGKNPMLSPAAKRERLEPPFPQAIGPGRFEVPKPVDATRRPVDLEAVDPPGRPETEPQPRVARRQVA